MVTWSRFWRIFQICLSNKLDHRLDLCRSVTPSSLYAPPNNIKLMRVEKKAWLQAWVLYIPHACGHACGHAFVTSRQQAAPAPGQGEVTPEHEWGKHRHPAQAPHPAPAPITGDLASQGLVSRSAPTHRAQSTRPHIIEPRCGWKLIGVHFQIQLLI